MHYIGDLDYFPYALGLPRYNTNAGPCALCPCNASDMPWYDFRPDAAWVGATWSSAAWRAWPGRTDNIIFTLPGVTALTVCLDWMHCKYLGADQYMFGAVLYILCFFVMPGTPEGNISEIWQFIQAYYAEHHTKTKYRYLNKLSMFVRKTGPAKLRGRASEVKHLGAALLALWEKYMRARLEVHRKIQVMLKLNVRLEQILYEQAGAFKFDEAAAREFRAAAFAMAQLHAELANHWRSEGYNLFDATTKTHCLLHIAMLAGCFNPRLGWCFGGEDMQQRVQLLAKSCVRGNTSTAATCKMSQHYRLGLHCLLSGFEDCTVI